MFTPVSELFAQLAHLSRGAFYVRLGEERADDGDAREAPPVELGDICLLYTSCPDQLAKALRECLKKQAK